MDPELREAIEKVTEASGRAEAAADRAATEAKATRTATNAATAATNAATAAVVDLTRKHAVLRRDFGVLWRTVKGSDPPPQGDPGVAPVEIIGGPALDDLAADAHKRASAASLDVAALEGRIIGVASQMTAVRSELAAQSKQMGIGKRGMAWLVSERGASKVLQILTAIGAIIAGVVALAHELRSPPSSASSSPAPPALVLPPASRAR